MNDAPEAFYQALLSRDPRFDGRFFVGVATTGIYCRSVCPAPKPKRRNCRFFLSAAAAEDDGFRPCKRCRPETAPGSPAWTGTRSLVARALQFIAEGTVTDGSVEQLAARLGISARHVRRLFRQHLGTSPSGVARTQRLHLAKQLIENTDLAMPEVAFGAGFGSLRSFNHEVKSLYGVPPGQLRRATRAGALDAAATVRIHLAFRPPYDWSRLARFFSQRALPGVEACSGGCYRRTVRIAGKAASVALARGKGNYLVAEIRTEEPAALMRTIERIRSQFDLNAEPHCIEEHLLGTPGMKRLVRRRPGLRVPGSWDPFELLIRAILGQQVTVQRARTLAGHLVGAFGEPVPAPRCSSGLTHLFPSAARLAGADLGGVGLTRARAATIRTVARRVAGGELVLDGGADPDTVKAQLLDIKGIGRWTVDYFAMRGIKDPDAFPHADAGLVNAARKLGIAADAASLAQAARAWAPWRAYAAVHLWQSL